MMTVHSSITGSKAAAGDRASTVSAATAQEWLASGRCVLVDVREADEHAREHIPGSSLVPLSSFSVANVKPNAGQCVVLHCKGGRRSAEACRLAGALVDQGVEVYSLDGGIEAWKAAGLPVVAGGSGPRVSVMRQVQMVIGGMLMAGAALAWFVHPAFIAVPAVLGAGLMVAGLTGTCGLAVVLAAMPWNRASGPGGSCVR